MMYYQVKPFTKQFVASASKLLAKIQSMPAQLAGREVILWKQRSKTGRNPPGLFIAWLFRTRFFIPVQLLEENRDCMRAFQDFRSVILFDEIDKACGDAHYPCLECTIEGDFIPTAGLTFIEQFDVVAKVYVRYMLHKASARAEAAMHDLGLLLEAKDVYETTNQTRLEN